jgi:hypothetical protein
MVMNLQVPLNVRSFLTSCGTISFSRRAVLHEAEQQVTVRMSTVRIMNSGLKLLYKVSTDKV